MGRSRISAIADAYSPRGRLAIKAASASHHGEQSSRYSRVVVPLSDPKRRKQSANPLLVTVRLEVTGLILRQHTIGNG